jgi:hypothetical protein
VVEHWNLGHRLDTIAALACAALRHNVAMAGPAVLITPSASPEQAAAIAAAIERFRADTAPPPAATSAPIADPWVRAGLLEGIGLDPDGDTPSPWDRWG